MATSIVPAVALESDANVLGQNIRSLREAQKLSREALAKRIGEITSGEQTLTPTALYYIESGRRQARPETLDAIAAGLGTTVRALHAHQPEEAPPSENPPGLQEMIEKNLADPPPDDDELADLRKIPWRGVPDGVSFLYALQAIRRAKQRG